ncbi:conserved hypothetical protein [gamma proteobacterium NOR5-3]|nr:conserved hypothetical protein [gamma proteobacterium NOR5-3]
MAIFRVKDSSLISVSATSFAEQGLRERQDLQVMIKQRVEAVSPDTLVVAEEFGEWDDSRRRIDLLGIDRDANLVVIELKRTEDGGHMELQAIRYAAMISTLTFKKLTEIYQQYLRNNGDDSDAEEALLTFLGWDEPDEDQFGQEVRIVLASQEFSKELTTSVIWLADYGLNIRCVRMRPYETSGETLIDFQQVIPVPETADYQVRIREKKQKERESRQASGERDFTKFDLSIGDKHYTALNKRWLMLHLVRAIAESGVEPGEISATIPWRGGLFHDFDGQIDSSEFKEQIDFGQTGGVPRHKRYFCDDGELLHVNGKTYAVSNQWGKRTFDAATDLAKRFSNLAITVVESGGE